MKSEIQLPSAPMDSDIPVATQVYEEYGTTTTSRGIPNAPKGKGLASEKVIGAAAIAGAVAGFVLIGPVTGIVGAVGAGALASQNNKAGEVARASGGVVISAGERAKKIDEKHHVVSKTKQAAGNFLQKGKELNEKHHIAEKSKKAAGDMAKKTKEFEEKHHLGEKAGKGLTKGLNFVSKQLKPKESK